MKATLQLCTTCLARQLTGLADHIFGVKENTREAFNQFFYGFSFSLKEVAPGIVERIPSDETDVEMEIWKNHNAFIVCPEGQFMFNPARRFEEDVNPEGVALLAKVLLVRFWRHVLVDCTSECCADGDRHPLEIVTFHSRRMMKQYGAPLNANLAKLQHPLSYWFAKLINDSNPDNFKVKLPAGKKQWPDLIKELHK